MALTPGDVTKAASIDENFEIRTILKGASGICPRSAAAPGRSKSRIFERGRENACACT
jgi:hypothetical protein